MDSGDKQAPAMLLDSMLCLNSHNVQSEGQVTQKTHSRAGSQKDRLQHTQMGVPRLLTQLEEAVWCRTGPR